MEGSGEGLGRSNVKNSIEYVCEVLYALGIGHGNLTPGVLHSAMLNEPSAFSPLLRSLHDLVVLQLACFPDPMNGIDTESELPHYKGDKRSADSKQLNLNNSRGGVGVKGTLGQAAAQCRREQFCKTVSCQGQNYTQGEGCTRIAHDMLELVKFYMALWGFPSYSPLFSFSSESGESRHILLGLGWLISHCGVFDMHRERRHRALLDAKILALLPPYSPDVSSTAVALGLAKDAAERAQDQVNRILAASNRISESLARAKARAEQVLMLHGRLRVATMSLHSLVSCKARCIHKLNQVQAGTRVLDGKTDKLYSQYELHLLEHPEELKRHIQALENQKNMFEENVRREEQEKIFWDWMADVAEDACHDQGQSICSSEGVNQEESFEFSGVTATELEPVNGYLQQHLTVSTFYKGENPSEARRTRADPSLDCSNIRKDAAIFPDDITIALRSAFEKNQIPSPVARLERDIHSLSVQDHDTIGNGNFQKSRFSSVFHRTSFVLRPDDEQYKETRELIFNDNRSASTKSCKRLIEGVLNGIPENETQSVDELIRRMTSANLVLARILAHTRSKNRKSIEQALMPLLGNNKYVFVGL